MFEKMIENKYKKRYENQKRIVARQLEEIESLKLEIEELESECEKKDALINSIEPMRNEMKQEISKIKEYKEEYGKLISELREMKSTMNQEVFNGRWTLIRFLIKLLMK